MSHKYVLSELEKLAYGNEERRPLIRSLAAQGYSVDEAIEIVDEEGNLFDTITGSEEIAPNTPRDREAPPREPEFSEEDILQMARLETELKPEVQKRLLNQARQEVAGELSSKTNEVLKLRAELGTLKAARDKTVSTLTVAHTRTLAELAKVNAENSKLKGQISRLKPALENPSTGGGEAELPPGAPR